MDTQWIMDTINLPLMPNGSENELNGSLKETLPVSVSLLSRSSGWSSGCDVVLKPLILLTGLLLPA